MDNQDNYKVFEKQNLCIQDEAPYCNDVCPLGVDARALARLVAENKLEAAYAEYHKRVIFPQIVARLCTAPCQGVCLRRDIDEAVQVRLLELACAEYAHKPPPKVYIPTRNGTAHIIGASLAGLACANTLARKGFTVHLYEKTNRLGGRLYGFINKADAALIEADIAQNLNYAKLHVHLETAVNDLKAIQDGCIMVNCAGIERPESDQFFLQTHFNADLSFEAEIAAGKRAATQMEHALKHEPSVKPAPKKPSRLLAALPEPLEKKNAVQPTSGSGYSRSEAVAEAARCLQCQCLACTKACLLLKSGGSYPKVYINHAQQSLKTIDHVHSKMAARRTNACNLCGLCGEICPNGLSMGEVYLKSRRIMHANGELPEAFHEFWLRDLAFSRSEDVALSRPQPGHERAAWLFFPGCQMGGSRPEYVIETYRFLAGALKGGVALHLDCCGAPSEWAGYSETTQPIIEAFRARWEALGQPQVILACPSCEKIFAAYHADIPRVSLWSVLANTYQPTARLAATGVKVALFDPCSSRNNPEEQRSIRRLLSAMGYQTEELPYHGQYAQCCGYGGLIYASNPTLADDIRTDRIAASDLPYVTYCVNCREVFASGGKPVWHMLDLLFGPCDEARSRQNPPDWSSRRVNRLELKAKLLKTFWGEEMRPEQQPYANLDLRIDAELSAKMVKNLIMVDDIKQVIYQAEQTGRKLSFGDGRFLAHLKIGHNTYWAEYRPDGEAFHLYNAYTHRMRIKEGTNV